MVSIGFTVLKEEIVAGIKTQTIRRASPHWLKVQPGTTLHLFWKLRTPECERLGEGNCIYRSEPIRFQEFDHDLSIRDGFTSLDEMQGWFRSTYKDKAETQEYVVIQWEPLWLEKQSELYPPQRELLEFLLSGN